MTPSRVLPGGEQVPAYVADIVKKAAEEAAAKEEADRIARMSLTVNVCYEDKKVPVCS